MNKFTLLDNAARGFGGVATGARASEIARRRDLDGECRHLFVAGGGSAEAAAGANRGASVPFFTSSSHTGVGEVKSMSPRVITLVTSIALNNPPSSENSAVLGQFRLLYED
jgi:hypothetical protein